MRNEAAYKMLESLRRHEKDAVREFGRQATTFLSPFVEKYGAAIRVYTFNVDKVGTPEEESLTATLEMPKTWNINCRLNWAPGTGGGQVAYVRKIAADGKELVRVASLITLVERISQNLRLETGINHDHNFSVAPVSIGIAGWYANESLPRIAAAFNGLDCLMDVYLAKEPVTASPD